METKPKHYTCEVRVDEECALALRPARYEIDLDAAREIIAIARFAEAYRLYKVEKFDYRVDYRIDPQADRDGIASPEGGVNTSADALCVCDGRFWFSAYLNFTNIELRTKPVAVQDLLDHFGAAVQPDSAPGDAHARRHTDREIETSVSGKPETAAGAANEIRALRSLLKDVYECLRVAEFTPGIFERVRAIVAASSSASVPEPERAPAQRMRQALQEISERFPADVPVPVEEQYEDLETAYGKGIDVANWQCAAIARCALASA